MFKSYLKGVITCFFIFIALPVHTQNESPKKRNRDLLVINKLTSNNEDFFKLLLCKYPDLSPAEFKLCAYLRLNPSTKDLALLLNRIMRTVESTRANIRKKMNLNPQDNLVTQLVSFSYH
jgi:DNA-binding CsgD family transcriptional regulator